MNTPHRDRGATAIERDSGGMSPLILGLIAALVLAAIVIGAIWLFDADIDATPGDVDVEAPSIDADVEAPEVDVEAPEVDPGDVEVEPADG